MRNLLTILAAIIVAGGLVRLLTDDEPVVTAVGEEVLDDHRPLEGLDAAIMASLKRAE